MDIEGTTSESGLEVSCGLERGLEGCGVAGRFRFVGDDGDEIVGRER